LIFFGLRKRLDTLRWIVGIAVLPVVMVGPIVLSAGTGRRLTHETISDTVQDTGFLVLGLNISILNT
jgi:hypothetical protein